MPRPLETPPARRVGHWSWLAAVLVWTLPSLTMAAEGAWQAKLRVGKPPRPTKARVVHADGTLALQVGGKQVPLPIAHVTEGSVRHVELASGARVAIVRLQGESRSVAAVITRRGGVAWLGRLDAHGDPGEQRRAVVAVADRTGDGVEDVIVGRYETGRGICGQQDTLLDPRAVDPATLRLRPVLLDRLEPADENEVVELEASPGSPGPQPAPKAPLLRFKAASSQAGTPPELSVTPPGMLTDQDATTFWMEGRGREGRGEFVTADWRGTAWPIRALSIVPVPEATDVPTAVPTVVQLVGDRGPRLRVTFSERPRPGVRYWVTPPEPLAWKCLSLVIEKASLPEAHPKAFTAIAELQAYSELDFGNGTKRLVEQLASDGRAGAEAVPWLRAMGSEAVTALRDAWPTLSTRGRRRAIRVLAASARDDEEARQMLASAVREGNDETRDAALAALIDALPTTIPQLLPLLRRPEPTGEQAALALARQAPARAVLPLLEALDAGTGSERPHLRRALRNAASDSQPDAERLEAWSLQASPPALAAAAQALAPVWPGHARRFLHRARPAADGFPTLWRLVQAAAELPQSDATLDGWLAQLARDDDRWMLRKAALNALHARDAKATHDVAATLTKDGYPRVRASALHALGPTADATRVIERHLRRDRWPLVRVAAMEALAARDVDVSKLRPSLADPARQVRAATIRALQRRDDRGAWPAIAERIRDENEWPEVASAGVAFAKALCLAEAAPTLQALIERALRPDPWTPDVDVAADALDALVTVAPQRAAKALEASAQPSSPPALRRTAEEAPERAHPCRPPNPPTRSPRS